MQGMSWLDDNNRRCVY